MTSLYDLIFSNIISDIFNKNIGNDDSSDVVSFPVKFLIINPYLHHIIISNRDIYNRIVNNIVVNIRVIEDKVIGNRYI